MADYASRSSSLSVQRGGAPRSHYAADSLRAAALNDRPSARATAQLAAALNREPPAQRKEIGAPSTVVQRVATFTFDNTLSVDTAVDLAIGEGQMDAAKRQDAIDDLNAITGKKSAFKTRKALFAYLSNRFAESDSEEGEAQAASSSSSASVEDDEEAMARENADFGKEDHTQSRKVGGGRKRDTGTGLFKSDPDFRHWVHLLKQKNKLEQYGVANRTGGADNIDKSDLKKLEAAYLQEKAL
ncbi:hypothetical protein [Sphingomonas sp. LM7]|uniref:hypothetical protein n=1 Tax=Sphingomonas sp. LM7 TaxID=1938607 RepID=UPI000983CCE7|nr:hypothetical protein [Sphingomonas sp. LM7]AQR73949.1 hypothetical protein BXU08_10080 [Sphingomonas sp. LM7]